MQPLLTIAVPTYNRVGDLKECLERVVEEAAGRNVEVLVSDNASSDGTETFMENFVAQHSGVRYYRNKENIGPDRNFLNCYEKANGEYVWLIGDDDYILPGALQEILKALERKPGFVHLNTSSVISMDPFEHSASFEPECGLITHKSKDALMQHVGVRITFVTSLILKTDYVRQIADKEKYIGTYFIQSHIALMTLEHEGDYISVTHNCIAATPNISIGYDLYFVWGKQYKDLMFGTGIACGISPEIIRSIHKRDMGSIIFSFVLQYRKTSKNSKKWEKKYILHSIRNYPKLYLKYFLAVCCPQSWFWSLVFVKQRLKSLLPRGL